MYSCIHSKTDRLAWVENECLGYITSLLTEGMHELKRAAHRPRTTAKEIMEHAIFCPQCAQIQTTV